MRALVALLLVTGVALWVVLFLAAFGTESDAERAADGAMLLVGVALLTALSFLIWPRRA